MDNKGCYLVQALLNVDMHYKCHAAVLSLLGSLLFAANGRNLL